MDGYLFYESIEEGESDMEIGKYIENKIKSIKQTHYYDGWLNSTDLELSRRWKRDKGEIDVNYQNIRDNNDVIDLIERFDGAVSFVEKNVKIGHIEDAYNMALAFHKALVGLYKMSKCIDASSSASNNFTKISEREIDELFNRLNSIAERMDEQNMRRAMSD